MRILVATNNARKLDELRRALVGMNLRTTSLGEVATYPEPTETGLTFEENALLKAREGVRRTGLATVADDSGLAVDVLNGMPGVFSARWCGKHGDDRENVRLLLAQVADVPNTHRGASFICAVALVLPDGSEHVVHGKQRGQLSREPRGTAGFGYDPIFIGEGQTLTNAELPEAEKEAINHRGQAFRAFRDLLPAFVSLGTTDTERKPAAISDGGGLGPKGFTSRTVDGVC